MNRIYLPRSRRGWMTVLICTMIVLGVVSLGMVADNERRIGYAHSPDNLLRLHVIPHSDAPADQHIKLIVRDSLLQEMSSWTKPKTQADLEAALRAHMSELRRVALATLNDAGFDHEVRVEIGNFDFDERRAGDVIFPAGNYRAVRVIIGAGAGQNWWCVLFPPLCFVDDKTDVEIGSVPHQDVQRDGKTDRLVSQQTEDKVEVRLKLWETVSESVYAEALREFFVSTGKGSR